MQISLAPMEGVTGYIIRNAIHQHFGGVDVFYTPFFPAAKRFSGKVKRDIAPENNKGIRLIPQVMSNRADEVIHMGHLIAEYGYDMINVNLGCPSGTVTSKKRGSGLLLYPEELDSFLDELFSKTDIKISLKTRIGYHDPDEWPRLLDIYKKYPFEELIIHPRVRDDIYRNVPRLEAFDAAVKAFSAGDTPRNANALCYNGDICCLSDYQMLSGRFPEVPHFMIGRGLLAHPCLATAIKEGHYPDPEEYRKKLIAFCDDVYHTYLEIFSGEKDALFRMKELWFYLSASFADSAKYLKKIQKCQSSQEYFAVVNGLFRELEIFYE